MTPHKQSTVVVTVSRDLVAVFHSRANPKSILSFVPMERGLHSPNAQLRVCSVTVGLTAAVVLIPLIILSL